jgi:hypothetical protein
MGMHGVVPVARIGRVDGDKRQVAQVRAPGQARGFAGVRLGDHGVGEGVGDAVLMDRDQADGPGRAGIAQPLDDARLRQAHAPLRPGLFGLHQLAVPGAMGIARAHHAIPCRPPWRSARCARLRPPCGTRRGCGGDWCRCAGSAARHIDDPRPEPPATARGCGRPRRWPGRWRAARTGCAVRAPRHAIPAACRTDRRDRRAAAPATPPPEAACRVAIGLAPLLQVAFLLQLLQQALEVDPRGALDVERLGDIALGGRAGMGGDPVEDLRLGGKLGHGFGLA